MKAAQRILPRALVAIWAVALIGACADSPTSLKPNLPSFHLTPVTPPAVELVVLCKVGPAGTYTFNAQASHPVLWNTTTQAYDLTSANYTIVVAAGSTIDVDGTTEQGACYSFLDGAGVAHSHIARASGSMDASVTIVETGIPSGIAFEKAVVYQNSGGAVTSSTTFVNSATGRLGGDGTVLFGSGIVFYNQAVPVFLGNSINVQTVIVAPTLTDGKVTSFTGSFKITAFDQPVTVTSFQFRVSQNGNAYFWQGNCSTSPSVWLNVAKGSTATVAITPSCAVVGGPTFKKGDDVRLQVIATLATGRVFSNSGFYKIP